MFCNKCGNKLPDGAAFYHICGSKTVVSEQINQESITTAPTSPAPLTTQYSSPPSGSLPAIQDVNSVRRKKTKASWVILGIVVLVAIAVFVALNWSNIDYIETVKQHRPYYSYGDLDYTIEEVINRYVVSPEWSDYESDGVTQVRVSGTLNGSSVELTLIFAVKPQGGNSASISLKSMELNDGFGPIGEERSKEVFGDMFTAYSMNYSTFIEYMVKYY